MSSERFFDEAGIFVQGGRGGNGCVSFRREKGIPRGGPNGGDGGDGGSVIIKVNQKLSTLIYYHYKKHFTAQNGGHGKGKNRKGKKGEDIILEVPSGTLVKDERDHILEDLKRQQNCIVVARGGRGGRGNAQFKSATHQAPREAETGEEGEKKWINLELKIIADVGIVGLPNAGKSTFLSRISSAHPKVASYPFTTLRPYLGIVRVGNQGSFVAADLPGLIEKASEGKGLGDKFLRHVERSKVLVHLVDVSQSFGQDAFKRFQIIHKELEQYNPQLLTKTQLVVGTKTDLPGAEKNLRKLTEKIGEMYPVMGISSKTGEGIKELIIKLSELVEEKNKQGSAS